MVFFLRFVLFIGLFCSLNKFLVVFLCYFGGSFFMLIFEVWSLVIVEMGV